jgi:signal transduction histidine kinase
MKTIIFHAIFYLIVIIISIVDISLGSIYSFKIVLILPFYFYTSRIHVRLRESILFGFFVSCAWAYIDISLMPNANIVALITNFIVRLAVLILVTLLINKLKEQRRKLKLLNNELQVAIKEKNEFVGIAAHDLRSPINIIFSYAELLLDAENINLTKKQVSFVEIIRKTSGKMVLLLKDTLDFTKIESGSLMLNKQPYDYLVTVREIIDETTLFSQRKNISIDFECSDNKIMLNIDRKRIEQVFQNLLSNAIKFSKLNTRIIIKVYKLEGMVQTDVIDQGIGIKEEELEHIFKPFVITSSKPTAGEDSSGLGLAIVKKLVEAHGGSVSVNSKLNIGTTFSFVLPE